MHQVLVDGGHKHSKEFGLIPNTKVTNDLWKDIYDACTEQYMIRCVSRS